MLQRQPEVLQRQTEESSETQTESETQSEPTRPPNRHYRQRCPNQLRSPNPISSTEKTHPSPLSPHGSSAVEEYMELAEIPADKQTRLAATWLSDTAKIWYINTYKDVKPLPSLEVFLKAFKEQHLTAHSKADVIKRAETIRQGTQRGANEYSTEFKMLVHQLGYKTNEPDAWVTRHYLRGLDRTVREGLIPHLEEEDTLDESYQASRQYRPQCRIWKKSRSGLPFDHSSFVRHDSSIDVYHVHQVN